MKPDPVVWFEIYVQDINRAQKFYETVLDVQLRDLPNSSSNELIMRAFPSTQEAPGSSGALVQMAGCPSGGNSTLVYFACEDCSIEESRVVPAGGTVFRPKMSIGEYGFISLVSDTEGNMFGLYSQA